MGEVGDGLFQLAALDEISGRLVLQEREDEDQASKDDVETRGDQLLTVSCALEIIHRPNFLTHLLCVVSPMLI